MKRTNKILTSIFAIVLALTFAVGASGVAWANNDGTDGGYRVNDYASLMTSEEEETLSDAAYAEVAPLQFDFVVYLTNRSDTAANLAKTFYSYNDCGYGATNDGIILCIKNDGTAAVYAEGLGTVLFSDIDTTKLAEEAVADLKQSGSVEAVYNFLQKTITKVGTYRGVDVSSRWPVHASAAVVDATTTNTSNTAANTTSTSNTSNTANTAANTSNATTTVKKTTADLDWYPADPSSFKDFHNSAATPRVVDNADLLTDAEEAELAAHLADMSARLGIDFVFLSDTSSYGLSRAVYAADFYQFNGYGLGDDYSGVIYFVCMEKGNRGYWTAARGSARDLLTEANVNKMDDATYDLFVDGKYSKAITKQFDNLDALYTNGSLPIDFTPFVLGGIAAIVIGIVGGFITLNKKRREMKTVAKANDASIYSVRGLSLTVNNDEHYNTVVHRTRHVEKSSGGGGGGRSSYSGGYSSSGGGSFSGGGRSF